MVEIGVLGLQHFCINDKKPIAKIKQHFVISNLSEAQTVSEIDWSFVYNQNDESKNFILLTDLNDWSYLIWSYWDFETNLYLTKKLSKILNTKVNYYFVDSHIATSRWIFADRNQITRAYYESHDSKLFDMGFSEIENNLRDTIEDKFVEDIFWDLYKDTAVSLENINNQKRTEVTLYTGTFV